jgi:hypothetical protein
VPAVRAATRASITTGFIEHYLVPIIYPDGLTPTVQKLLAVAVVLANVLVYAWPRRGRRVSA